VVSELMQRNGDNMYNVRREASRTFRAKRRGISEKKLKRLNRTVRIKILETYTEA
jgi:hypothetical protein